MEILHRRLEPLTDWLYRASIPRVGGEIRKRLLLAAVEYNIRVNGQRRPD